MTLTKKDLKNLLSNYLNIPKVTSNSIIESFSEIIKETLESGEDVMISGFGKFSILNKGDQQGRNPATGEKI